MQVPGVSFPWWHDSQMPGLLIYLCEVGQDSKTGRWFSGGDSEWESSTSWVTAHAVHLPGGSCWGIWERRLDVGDCCWRLKFVCDSEGGSDSAYTLLAEFSSEGDAEKFIFNDGKTVWTSASRLGAALKKQPMPGLWEQYVVYPEAVQQAVRLVREQGFAVMLDILHERQQQALFWACRELEAQLLERDSKRMGSRGRGRYTLTRAGCSGMPAWINVVALPSIVKVVEALLGPDALCINMGADFVIAGVSEYQSLHSDLFSWPTAQSDEKFGGRPPFIAVNFTVHDIAAHHGPMRIVPGTQHSTISCEPSQALHCALAPLPSGCAIIRDVRTWHSGTPNLGPRTRFLPCCEYVPAAYLKVLQEERGQTAKDGRQWASGHYWPRRIMPTDLYEGLSLSGKRLCRYLRANRLSLEGQRSTAR